MGSLGGGGIGGRTGGSGMELVDVGASDAASLFSLSELCSFSLDCFVRSTGGWGKAGKQ